MKSVQIRRFFWSVFSRIPTEYGEIRRISSYSVRMWENTDQKNSVFRHFSRSVNKNIMRLVILGATGRTGQCLLQQALNNGHEVIAVVRHPQNIFVSDDNLTVKQANIFEYEELENVIKDADSVLSTLGFSFREKPVNGYSKVTELLVKAQREVGCKRLILLHSWFTKEGMLAKQQSCFYI